MASSSSHAESEGYQAPLTQLLEYRRLTTFGCPHIVERNLTCRIQPFVRASDGSRKNISLDEVLALANASAMEAATYGDKHGDRRIDECTRLSKLSQSTFFFDIEPSQVLNDEPASHVEVFPEFEFLKYPVKGHFVEHNDCQRPIHVERPGYRVKHNHTVCIYPPQSVVGGELVFKMSSGDVVVPMPKDNWLVLIFQIDLSHLSKSVKSGEKVLFKGLGLSVIDEKEAHVFYTRRSKVSD